MKLIDKTVKILFGLFNGISTRVSYLMHYFSFRIKVVDLFSNIFGG